MTEENRPENVLPATSCRGIERIMRGQVMSPSERLWVNTISFLQAEIDRIQSQAPGEQWRSMDSAPKDESVKIELGILRRGKLDEIHIGGWRDGDEDHDEYPCWWSDQADDEINPQVWRPHYPVTLPAPPSTGGEQA